MRLGQKGGFPSKDPFIYSLQNNYMNSSPPPFLQISHSHSLRMLETGMYILKCVIFFPNRARPGSIFFPISFFCFARFARILTLSMALKLVHIPLKAQIKP